MKEMNKIIRTDSIGTNGEPIVKYQVFDASGRELECRRWYEKSHNKYHCMITDKNNTTGRKYICENLIAPNSTYEFETSTKEARVLGSGSSQKKSTQSWMDYMTEEEKKTYEKIKTDCEDRMNQKRTTDIKNQIFELYKKLGYDDETCRVLTEKLNNQK